MADDFTEKFNNKLKIESKITNGYTELNCATKIVPAKQSGLKQYNIFKLNTFDLFTEEENRLYNEHRDNKTLKEFNKILAQNKNKRIVNPEAMVAVNEILVFDSDLLRIIRKTDLPSHTLVKEIMYIEIYHIEILEQIIKNGFMCGGKSYEFFTATSGQVRNKCCTFIDCEVIKEKESAIMNGLTDELINESAEKGVNTGKYLAYKGLTMTSSLPIDIDIDRVIVVDDFETEVVETVECIDTKTFITEIKEMPVPVNHCDGAGMVLPGVLNASCQIRGSWIKGALFPFDFKKFSLEVAENTKIKDIYGSEHDIVEEDIQIILTKSQFKMWKYYDSWNDYKTQFKKNNLKLSILNESNEHSEQKETAYQYLQTLDRDKLTDKKIAELCNVTVNKIKALYVNPEDMMRILGAIADNKDLKPLQEALLIYPELLHDSHIETQVRKTVASYRRAAMAGKIIVDGFYSYICPDLYALCERVFQGIKVPGGLIPNGKVYNGFYNDKDVAKCDLLRSPHLYNEHCIREFIKDSKCEKWFVGHDTVVSTHDLAQRTLMCDVDGDECLITTSKALIDLVRPCVPLYYEMYKAPAKQVNPENIYETLKCGFENNNIGIISNSITKLWNSDDVKIDLERIKLLQMYNNFTIDYPKTGQNIELTSAMQEELGVLEKQKPPYFFQYAKNKNSKKCKPSNNSVVNRISIHIKSNTNNLRYKPFGNNENKFDGAKLQNHSIGYEVRRDLVKYNKLQKALFIWERKINHLATKFNEEKNKNDEFKAKFDIHYQYCKEELLKIYNGNINLLVNAFVDIEYLQPCNRNKKQRNILWNCFGDVLVKNLKFNLNGDREVKSRPRLAYSRENKQQYDAIKPRIAELDTPKTANITAKDMEKINGFKPKYKNDRLIYYVLMCLCKAYENKLVISKGNGKNKKYKINAHTINQLAGTTTFSQAIERLQASKLITILNSKKKMTISLVTMNADDTIFEVKNVWKPILYLEKFEGNPVGLCEICGAEFIKSGNAKTCCEACSRELMRRNKQKIYAKSKNVA